MSKKKAIIIGAGPSGLTAGYELLKRTDIRPIIYEKSDQVGGIAKTVKYKGNRIDFGGHRFFSKSDRVMEWWKEILPLQGAPSKDDILFDRDIPLSDKPDAPDPEETDRVMLVRSRLSRIYYLGEFFDYPISLSLDTLLKLGPLRVAKIILSYLKASLSPIENEDSLEDFFINRFGRELYSTFFKDYTEKVWGIPCKEIGSEWGAQRVKGLSIKKAVMDALKSAFSSNDSVSQKDTETSLIKQFMYPKLGPGQLWEEVARLIEKNGGKIFRECEVKELESQGSKIEGVKVHDTAKNEIRSDTGKYFFSTMPVNQLIDSLELKVPKKVREVAQGLDYRSFITVGLLMEELKIKNETEKERIDDLIPENWIYIQEKGVKLGRLQIFNNWSPYLVDDFQNKVWIGLEYFCDQGDELWNKPDEEMINFAIKELSKINIAEREKVLDSVLLKMPKAYPAYFGTYHRFHIIKEFVNQFKDLFLIGRNGMHRYNNMDHSMLTAMKAVDSICDESTDKEDIWSINTEQEYHEKKEGTD